MKSNRKYVHIAGYGAGPQLVKHCSYALLPSISVLYSLVLGSALTGLFSLFRLMWFHLKK